jgi:hypothetical protein
MFRFALPLSLLTAACTARAYVLPERSVNYPDEVVYLTECTALDANGQIQGTMDQVMYFTNDYEVRAGQKTAADASGTPSDSQNHDGFYYHVGGF